MDPFHLIMASLILFYFSPRHTSIYVLLRARDAPLLTHGCQQFSEILANIAVLLRS